MEGAELDAREAARQETVAETMARKKLSDLVVLLRHRGLLCTTPDDASFEGAEFSGISFDPEEIQSGDIWVNLYGNSEEARGHLRHAEQSGARALVSEFPHKPGRVPHLRVLDPRGALSCAAAFLYEDPSQRMALFGVTGSVGKSTIVCMASRCLEFSGHAHGMTSSACWRIGQEVGSESEKTTHGAPELQRRIGKMLESGARKGLLEVSSQGVVHQRVADVSFHGALLSNLGREHEEFHPTFRDYLEAKARLFRGLPTDGVALINADAPWCRTVAAGTRASLFCFGHGADADVCVDADSGRVTLSGRFAERYCRGALSRELRLQLRVPGTHNLSNACAAAALAMVMGASGEAVCEALNSFPGLPGRCQSLLEGPVGIFHDMFERPAMRYSFPHLEKEHPKGGYIVVIAPREHRRPREYRATVREFLSYAERHHLSLREIIVSRLKLPEAGSEYVLRREKALLDALARASVKVSLTETLESAVQRAIERVRPGQKILMLCERMKEKPQELMLALLEARKPRWYDRKNWAVQDPEIQVRHALMKKGE